MSFLHEPPYGESLVPAVQQSDLYVALNMAEGYEHSYFFMASFIEEHWEFHAGHMGLI
jgi:Predicted esterase